MSIIYLLINKKKRKYMFSLMQLTISNIYKVSIGRPLLAERHCIQTVTSAEQNKPSTAFSALTYLVQDCYMN